MKYTVRYSGDTVATFEAGGVVINVVPGESKVVEMAKPLPAKELAKLAKSDLTFDLTHRAYKIAMTADSSCPPELSVAMPDGSTVRFTKKELTKVEFELSLGEANDYRSTGLAVEAKE